jgi:hypothetical protein
MKEKALPKVVVRMLPANLTEDAFWKLIEERVKDQVDFWYYVPGKLTQRKYVTSRAYLNFKNPESVNDFYHFFNGHIFVNPKGVEEKAVVEFAPYQKVPKPRKRPDPRMGTIENDADYLRFLEKLKEQPAPLPSAEVQLDKRLAEEKEKMAAAGGVLPPIITPLIEEIRAKRAARNAPKTILHSQKRHGDLGKKRAKGDKDKRDDKRRDRSSRKKDREERRKKRKDTEKGEVEKDKLSVSDTQQGPPGVVRVTKDRESRRDKGKQREAQAAAAGDGDPSRKSRNGIWMIRRHLPNLEPGSITIQTRDKPLPQQQQQPQQPEQLQLQQQATSASVYQQVQQPPFPQVNIAPAASAQQQQPLVQPFAGRRPQRGMGGDYGRNKGVRPRGGGGGAETRIYTPKQHQQQQDPPTRQYHNYLEGM